MGMKEEVKPNRCVFCGNEARVIHFDDNMWYVVCSSQICRKHDRYAYLGNTKNNAVDQWNFSNREGSFRKSSKAKK